MQYYIGEKTIVFEDPRDPRFGKYFVYDINTFDYLVNNYNWAFNSEALAERDYILKHLDKSKESKDGKYMFIPTPNVARKIDEYNLLKSVMHFSTITI